MNIKWKDIDGYEGLYKISNTGIIKSLDRTAIGNQQNPFRKLKGKVLKACIDGMGYKRVNLLKDGIQISVTIHRMLAIHFILNPENKREINHKDGNKLNNNIFNLEWCTHEHNMKHASNIKLLAIRGNHHNSSKIIQLTKSGVVINKFKSIIEASLHTNINASTISRNCRGGRPSAGGFVWKYDNNGKVDCSVIAKQYRGGGHKGAAGMVIDDLSKIF